eukprot:11846244-Ditylum_brightwellii.AAC.1
MALHSLGLHNCQILLAERMLLEHEGKTYIGFFEFENAPLLEILQGCLLIGIYSKGMWDCCNCCGCGEQ